MKRTYKVLILVASGACSLSARTPGRRGQGRAFLQSHPVAHRRGARRGQGHAAAARRDQRRGRSRVRRVQGRATRTTHAELEAGAQPVPGRQARRQGDRRAPRSPQEAEAKKVGDAVVQAIYDAHDALTAPQRAAIAEYVASRTPSTRAATPACARSSSGTWSTGGIDDGARRDQGHARRSAPRCSPPRIACSTRSKSTHADHGADFDQAMALFTADKIDGAQVEAMRAEHQAKMQQGRRRGRAGDHRRARRALAPGSARRWPSSCAPTSHAPRSYDDQPRRPRSSSTTTPSLGALLEPSISGRTRST